MELHKVHQTLQPNSINYDHSVMKYLYLQTLHV